MSRYDLSELTLPSDRNVLDMSNSHAFLPPLNLSDRRSSHNPHSSSPESLRALASIQSHQEERGVVGYAPSHDPWVYPQRDPSLQRLDVDALWNRPSDAEANKSTPSPNITAGTGNSRVASSPVSSFNHHKRAVLTSSSTRNALNNNNTPSPPVTQQRTTNNNSLYTHYSEYIVREEPLLHLPPTSALPVSSPLPQPAFESAYTSSRSNKNALSRSTLWWGDLEPWMDEQYAKQVCELMNWPAVSVKIPQTMTNDPTSREQPNNPGYCFLTFPTSQHAATVLTQINNPRNGVQPTMPNSNKPFMLNWATSPSPSAALQSFGSAVSGATTPTATQKEYSIFVGDLAPETSNSDLVAVFRNPVLGLRNDRAPKFIRPFYSCKSAKIMLDPVTGVSRGYGFVRFTDEGDQQRALIEMHGLYCLSRPMRISPATAKFKGPSANGPGCETAGDVGFAVDPSQSGMNFEHSLPAAIAAHNGNSVTTSRSGSSIGSSASMPSMTTSSTTSSVSTTFPQQSVASLDTLAQLIAKGTVIDTAEIAQYAMARQASSITAPLVEDQQQKLDESWKHHAQARAILGNLIGPNGEQLTSTDPYNTTVFVGGLSPLISEETLRTFFAPFGDIHYVKVPTGKHCGFVQFVRKADAERAIERMQGFPIGGSRIRLSWGRSQYKAAQAAAQAAAAAQAQAAQVEFLRAATTSYPISEDQASEFLQKLGYNGYSAVANNAGQDQEALLHMARQGLFNIDEGGLAELDTNRRPSLNIRSNINDNNAMLGVSNFSPFSPDPNYLEELAAERRAYQGLNYADVSSRAAPNFGHRSADLYSAHVVDNERVTPSNSGSASMRSSTPSQNMKQTNDRQNMGLNGSAAPFQLNRAPGRPITESGSSTRLSSHTTSPSQAQRAHDTIQDLNGTLASLDLDANANARSPSGMTDSSSGGSVQFRLTASGPGSPSKQ